MEELFGRGIMKMGPSKEDPNRQTGVFNMEFLMGLPALRRAEMSLRACGPRNLMKIAESMMLTARSSEIESLNGEVEAVEMSDPERA